MAVGQMEAHCADSYQKVMCISPTPPPKILLTANESHRSALGSKGGISFVIPKNKLSGALVPVVPTLLGKREPDELKMGGDDVKTVLGRKTRWGIDLMKNDAVKRGRALALQTRVEQIAAQLETGQFDFHASEHRSPSPPPIYDVNGQRINTREGRRREQLEIERREAIGECLLLHPTYKPPSGYKPVYREAKLYIPVKDHPGYNFIGLILGPRGNTQKRMEAETGAKIAIRGRGAVKEGKGGRRDGKDAESAVDDLHVHIVADTIEKVEAAVALIAPLLTPVDEERNTHKRKQLRELAEMNGTMRDLPKGCSVCGGIGHKDLFCPKDQGNYLFHAKVSCQLCGNAGHPSGDCAVKSIGQDRVLDKEYLSFLEELGDGLAGANTGSGESVKGVSPAVPSGSATTVPGPTKSYETPLDPNELADVINQPRPMLITASGAQPMPPAWAPVGMLPNGSEATMDLQQGKFVQVDSAKQLYFLPSGSSLQPPGTSSFNVPATPFTGPGCPPGFRRGLGFQGKGPSPVVPGSLPGIPNLPVTGPGAGEPQRITTKTESSSQGGQFPGTNIGGARFVQFPPGPPIRPTWEAGPCMLNSPFLGGPQSQPNSSNQVSSTPTLVSPSSMPTPILTGRPWAPPFPGSMQFSNWNAVAQQPGSCSFPLVWKNGPSPQQQPSTMWPLPSAPPLDRVPTSTAPPVSVQPSSSYQEMKQKPWEVNPLCPPFAPRPPGSASTMGPPVSSTAGPPTPLWNGAQPPPNVLWKVPQSNTAQQYPLADNFLRTKFALPPSSPMPIPMPTSRLPACSPSPQSMPSSQTSQSTLLTPPPGYVQTQLNLKPSTFANFGSKQMELAGSFAPHPLPQAFWGQCSGSDLARPHSARGRSLPQSCDSAPLLAGTALTICQHQPGAPPGFGILADPNTGRSHSGLPTDRVEGQSAQSHGCNFSSTNPSLIASTACENDAEYEKLMASVGVT